MILRKLSFALVAFCASFASAERVSLPDVGLSVYVPPGWMLSNLGGSVSDTESTREWSMFHQTDSLRADFTFEAMDHVGLLGARSWTSLQGYGESIFLQGLPMSELFIDDSVQHDGLFAWRVYGRYGEFGPDSLPVGMVDRYSRSFANGDIGWTISFEGDTGDVDTAGPTYTRILDSVKVDRSFQSLPLRGRDRNHRSAFTPSRIVGGTLEIAGADAPLVRAIDALGRSVPGDLAPGANGWIWTPRARRPGLVLVRIQSIGRDESLRAVFRP